MPILLIIFGILLGLFGGGCMILANGDYPHLWAPPLLLGTMGVVAGVKWRKSRFEKSKRGD